MPLAVAVSESIPGYIKWKLFGVFFVWFFFLPSSLLYICLVWMSSAILSSITQCHGVFLQLFFFSPLLVFFPLKNLSSVANSISFLFCFPDHSWMCWAAEALAKIPVGFHLYLPFTEKMDYLLQLFCSDLLVSYPCEDLPSYLMSA